MQANTVGERLALARTSRGWSQTELGKACDMAPTQVSRYEADRAVPRRATLTRVALALAVRYKWLVSGEGPMEEYSATEPSKELTFTMSAALAERLQNYAATYGYSLEAALADVLDYGLSTYGPDNLPRSAEEMEEIAANPYREMGAMRLKTLAGKVKVLAPIRSSEPASESSHGDSRKSKP